MPVTLLKFFEVVGLAPPSELVNDVTATTPVGVRVGLVVGFGDGARVGLVEGLVDGCTLGTGEGAGVLGLAEMACVGVGEGAGVAMGTVNDWVTY